MVYIRGQHEDYDHWRQLGNPAGPSTDVLPYFKRAEHQQRGADEFHGAGGPLAVSDAAHHELCEAFISAGEESASLATPTSTARNRRVPAIQLTTRRGRRCSTAVGYLRPVMKRPNLRIDRCARPAHPLRRPARGRRAFPPEGRPVAQRAAERSCSRAAPSTRRKCSSCPASVVPRICASTVSGWSTTCRASGKTCRTIHAARSSCTKPITFNDVC